MRDRPIELPHWRYQTEAGPPVRADVCVCEALNQNKGEWIPAPPQGFSPSRAQVQRWIEEGHLMLETHPPRSIKAGEKLPPGLWIELKVPAPIRLELKPEHRDLEILFEDEHLLVINKPAGISVHPSSSEHDGTLVHALLSRPGTLSSIGGVERPGIVHRLDKHTSGVLVVSKTDQAHAGLTALFSKHDIDRRYWALVYGTPKGVGPGKETRIQTTIGRNPNDRIKMKAGVKDGKVAITHFKLIEEYGTGEKAFASFVEARLETGRTHQVRVHLTELGSSLLGDPLYGAPTTQAPKWRALPKTVQEAVEGLSGQALHARTLGFKHPITQAPLFFEGTPPAAFSRLMGALKEFNE